MDDGTDMIERAREVRGDCGGVKNASSADTADEASSPEPSYCSASRCAARSAYIFCEAKILSCDLKKEGEKALTEEVRP